jgi:uncharacterized DUF497 family protein
MTFEWDAEKAIANKIKHGIRFEDALHAFYDPWALYFQDPEHSESERREKVIGICDIGFISIIFTEPHEETFRIISARKGTPQEEKEYAQRRGI